MFSSEVGDLSLVIIYSGIAPNVEIVISVDEAAKVMLCWLRMKLSRFDRRKKLEAVVDFYCGNQLRRSSQALELSR